MMKTMLRLIFAVLLVGPLLLTGAFAEEVAEVYAATPYGAGIAQGVTTFDGIIVPLAWTCSPWVVISTTRYCDDTSICSSTNGCPARMEDTIRVQECCDEAGNCYESTSARSMRVGCCTADICLDPNFMRELQHLEESQ